MHPMRRDTGRYPWGTEPPDATRGVFDFSSWDPEPAGSHPAGRSAWGVDDLAGNGWEWTSSVFAPFPGFRTLPSYPEYSADFFDGEHVVLKGASPATARELLRPSFRNWFRPRYPLRIRDVPLRADGESHDRVDCRRPMQPQDGEAEFVAEFAADVRRHLAKQPRQIPSRYLYDALGSSLFDAICELPWYRVTRAEMRLLVRFAPRIWAAVSPLDRIIELGAGDGRKLAALLSGRPGGLAPQRIDLVDISATALESAVRAAGVVAGTPRRCSPRDLRDRA